MTDDTEKNAYILDNMKYKKIIELLPAYTLFIFLLSTVSSSSSSHW